MSNSSNEINQNERPSKSYRLEIGLILLSILLFFGAFCFGYFKLLQMHQVLSVSSAELQEQMATTKNKLEDLQTLTKNAQSLLNRASELTKAQENQIANWSKVVQGDLSKWYLAEGYFNYERANDVLQSSYDLPQAIVYIQNAMTNINNAKQTNTDTRITDVEKAMQNDLANLKTKLKNNVTDIFSQLLTLDNHVNQLIIPTIQNNLQASTPKDANLPWWKLIFNKIVEGLSHIVIVRNTSDKLPLQIPEEKTFLMQNLHAQLQNAMWADLHHNKLVYQTSLANAADWIKEYFVQNEVAKDMLDKIDTLKSIEVELPNEQINRTLGLLLDLIKNESHQNGKMDPELTRKTSTVNASSNTTPPQDTTLSATPSEDATESVTPLSNANSNGTSVTPAIH